MASPDTQRPRRKSARPRQYRFLGVKLTQKELVIVSGCVLFLCIAAIGIILSGRPEVPDRKPAEPPVEADGQEPQPRPQPLALSQADAALDPGGLLTLSASGGEGDVTWMSSDEKVAVVADGVVTGVAGGTASITAVSGGESAVCTVTVSGAPYVDVGELYLNHTDFTLRPEYPPEQMRVKFRETREVYEGPVEWSSADETVATISETGLVERVGKGTTTVRASIHGQVLECIVRVR